MRVTQALATMCLVGCGVGVLSATPMQSTSDADQTHDATGDAEQSDAEGDVDTEPAEITVSISPPATQLVPGATQSFSCIVTGTTDSGCTWSVEAGGTITPSGVYTAPASPGNYRVIARSTADTTKSDVANVVVTGPATPGVWTNVTPANFFVGLYGAQDVIVHPQHPNVLYAFSDLNGCWRSDDFGQTFVKQSNDDELESGSPWGEAIAPDGSYMLACAGYGDAGAWRSESKDENGILDGKIWTRYSMGPGGLVYKEDVYNFTIDPGDPEHVLACGHNEAWLKESFDGGKSWTIRDNPGWGASSYVFFVTSSIWLVVSAAATNGGTWQSSDSGEHWVQTGPTLEHLHGETQYADLGGGVLLLPTESGIYRSTTSGGPDTINGGPAWTLVSSQDASSIVATATTIYATAGFPNATAGSPNASYGPKPQHASRAGGGVTWTQDTPTPGMFQGAKRTAVTHDGTHYVLVGGHWNAGIWRYVEP